MLNQAFGNLERGDYELALVSIIPQFEKGCKETWPKLKVGARFKKGIEETEDIISFVMVGGRGTITACTYNGKMLPELLYKNLRNTVVHEGEMPTQFRISKEPIIHATNEYVQFPIDIVKGLLIATIGFESFRKYSRKVTQVGYLEIKGQKLYIKDMVGNHSKIREIIPKRWQAT